ncbi:MAG TPA: hypothetical protein VGG09_12395 [Acidimicrobiales bacterium]
MNAALTFVFGLCLAGCVPAVAAIGLSPATFFLAPFIGAASAAVAVELEVGIGGTMVPWFVVVAVVVNVLSFGILLRRRSFPTWEGGGWSLLLFAGVLGALAVPLIGLRTHEVGYDPAVIWTTHTLLISSGHQTLVSGLQNPVYAYSSPSYPPLVPAVGALGYAFAGRSVLVLGPELTALLNAAAVGLIATGIAKVSRPATRRGHAVTIALSALICLVCFGVGGDFGVNGYTDVLWSAAAVGAVVWGLVLPRSRSNLQVAWSCAIVASLTKDEGLLAAVAVLLLIALRFRSPLLRAGSGDAAARRELVSSWATWVCMVVGPALPGLIWAIQIRTLGIKSYFFGTPQSESLSLRASATVAAMSHYLAVVPAALLVILIGCAWFRGTRRTMQLGHPGWLWAAWAGGVGCIFATYVFGSPEIHWWLSTSVDRTTIFARMLLLTDIAIWTLVALNGLKPGLFEERVGGGTGPPEAAVTPGPAAATVGRQDRGADERAWTVS